MITKSINPRVFLQVFQLDLHTCWLVLHLFSIDYDMKNYFSIMLSLPFRLVISNQGFSLFFQMKISTSFAECFYGCYRLDTLEKCGSIIKKILKSCVRWRKKIRFFVLRKKCKKSSKINYF